MGSISQTYPEKHESWLPDHACLWRYVPLRTLLLYLTGNIFIPAIETLQLEDPFEGKFLFDTVWFNTAMSKRHGERVNALDDWLYRELCSESEKKHIEINKDYPNYAASIFEQHYFAFLRKTRYAWCWFLSESESAAMWNNYGKQGVAIATTVGKLRDLLKKTERDFVFGQMRYIRVVGGEAVDYYRVLAALRGGNEHNMLMFSEKQIRKARAYFRDDFSESLEVVLCGYSCTNGRRFDRVECPGDAATLRWVAFADYGTGAGRGPAFCGRSGDRRKLLWPAPGARQTRAWRGRQDPGDWSAQARRQGLHRDRRELLQASPEADHQGSGALRSHRLYRWLEVL